MRSKQIEEQRVMDGTRDYVIKRGKKNFQDECWDDKNEFVRPA